MIQAQRAGASPSALSGSTPLLVLYDMARKSQQIRRPRS
jgi:hypothetical protein